MQKKAGSGGVDSQNKTAFNWRLSGMAHKL
jgi:hypothetical protein